MLVEKGSVCKVLCGFKNTVFRKHFIRPNHCNYTRYHWNQKFLWSIENKILPVINEVRVKFKWFPYFPHKTHCKSLIHKQKRSVSNRVGCKHIRRPKIRMALSVWGRIDVIWGAWGTHPIFGLAYLYVVMWYQEWYFLK